MNMVVQLILTRSVLFLLLDSDEGLYTTCTSNYFFVVIISWLSLLSSFFATFIVTSIGHFVNAIMFYDLFELVSRD